MINKKILTILISSSLIQVALFAKQDADMISYKDYVEKKPTSIVQKKQFKEFDKSLPESLQKGQIAKDDFLNKGTMINTNKYENIKNTDIYRVNNRIFRIARNTNEILDILK